MKGNMDSIQGNITDIKTAIMEMAKSGKKQGAGVSSAVAKKSSNSKRKKKVTIAASAQKSSDSDGSEESEDDKPVLDINTVA